MHVLPNGVGSTLRFPSGPGCSEVRNLPAMQYTWVQSLGWKDPLEKGTATHSSSLPRENSMDCIVHGVAKSPTQLSNFHFQQSYM